jgi:transcriptional regulator with XRE-family HTH domain
VRIDPTRADQDRINLADALRELRGASGLSGERLARRCGMSQSKVSRIETGRLLPSVVDVDLMLHALGVDDETRNELLALAQIANAEYQDNRAAVRRGLHHVQRELAAKEADATRMRHFLPALVTGLLQTPEYMRTAMSTDLEPFTADNSRAIALKLERQAALDDPTKRFEFLLTESAVRWRLCETSVMAAQMDQLVSVSRLPSVRIGVLPLSAQVAHGPMSTFVTYDARLVTLELYTGLLVLRDPKDIEHYGTLFEFFSLQALWADDARTFLSDVAAEFRTK